MKRNLILILLAIFSLVMVACSSSDNEEGNGESKETDKDGDELLIGGAIMNYAWPWFLGTMEGMEEEAKNYDDKVVTFEFHDGQNDINTQINQLENMAQKGIDGLVIFPTDTKAIIPTMVKLHEQGIKIVVGDYPQTPDSEDEIVWETFVGHDFKAMGEVAGRIAVADLKERGIEEPTVVYLSLPSSGEASNDRFEGFSQTIKKEFPNANIIEEGDSEGSRNSSQTLFENVLQRQKEVDIVSGHNDSLVLGAYSAAISSGKDKDIRFIGMAGDKEVLKHIQDGNESWIGEVLQDPVVLGETALKALLESLDGAELDERYPLPEPEAIIPDNISDYDWENWEWLG
ncbi:ABC-type sugar transport system substrate-binding protein [Pseudogracilibacillus auburnensis]|uniref:ABC-type sugar transport system substrate-binding protein n=1 Tax=Pseudogracilibacillus auburnensis TaxID=1494959 RepID=A0A2V3VZF5_9BACI|nr:sugar ABC transporter substrate-binding protein [Pseudogracilibacillus auburnensis]PXW86291.1 ABC-type sugar transport system substrate-binding protein [Pseudogracilibacillus auburnensis]